MNEIRAKEIIDRTFRDVFEVDNPFSLEEFQRRFAFDINLPRRVKDTFTGKETWADFTSKYPNTHAKYLSKEKREALWKTNYWARPKKRISSMDDVLKYWSEIDYVMGEGCYNSKEVAESDNVNNSSDVFRSVGVMGSQNVVFSEEVSNCKYMIAGFNSAACTSDIRVFKSAFCSSSFGVMSTEKISRSMFVMNSSDLHECLFCTNLDSKSYCIDNMQFSKEEYFKIKKMVVDWIIENFGKNEKSWIVTR